MAAVGLLAPLKALPARPRCAAVRVRAAAGPPAGGSKGGAKPRPGQPWKKARGGAPRPGFLEDDVSPETGRPKSEAERVAPKYKAVQAEMRGDAPPAAPAAASLVGDDAFDKRLAALKASAPPPPPAAQAAAAAQAAGPLASSAEPLPPPPPAADPEAPSATSNAIKVIAVLCVVVYGLAFGLEDILGGGGGSSDPSAPLSASQREKLQKVVDEFVAAQAAAAPDVVVTKNALAAGQAATRLEEWKEAAAAFDAALAGPASDADVALPGRVDALVRDGRATEALAAVAAFEVSPAGRNLASSGLDDTDLRLLRAKALAARGDGAEAEAVFDKLAAESPDDFRPLLAKGLFLRDQGPGRALAADKAFVQARLLAPKDARKMVDRLIGDR